MPLLSSLYGHIIAAKRSRALAQAQRIGPTTIPVISVGNFTFGATGKTPCVLFLTEMILQHTASLTGAQGEPSKRVPLLLTRVRRR
jgi:tetraacyldisaccharide-1-P 4'-kinase